MVRNTKLKDKSVAPELSVIVPFFNEEDNVVPIYEEISTAMVATGQRYEIVFINDGSRDSTIAQLRQIAEADANVLVIDLLRNYGQTAAMMAGFDHAKGNIIIAMDGDGQNDPAEVPRLLAELEKGYDVVSGWRKNRQDNRLARRLPSKIANWLISKVTGVNLHDYGCSLKAYRRHIIDGVKLYGEMHRFIPIYTVWQGGRISELPVNHRARLHGVSKYGLNRVFKVLLDLLLVSFLDRYLNRPIYVFGGVGFLLLILSIMTASYAVWLKLAEGVSFISTPLPMLTGTFFTTGLICVLMGFLAELIMRTYYESQGKNVYQVRERINMGDT